MKSSPVMQFEGLHHLRTKCKRFFSLPRDSIKGTRPADPAFFSIDELTLPHRMYDMACKSFSFFSYKSHGSRPSAVGLNSGAENEKRGDQSVAAVFVFFGSGLDDSIAGNVSC